MIRPIAIAFCLAALTGLPGCRIIKNAPEAEGEAAAATTDEARMAALVDETWEARLLPLVAAAPDMAALRAAVAGGLDAAGAKMGNRGAGDGGPWSFFLRGTGVVIAANLESRARKAEVDTDGDGAADVTLQLGPVIKGTSLRDAAPFLVFSDFRDQIEFAVLARQMNDRASAGLTVPEGLVGSRVEFGGAVTLKSATEPWAVTLVSLTVQP